MTAVFYESATVMDFLETPVMTALKNTLVEASVVAVMLDFVALVRSVFESFVVFLSRIFNDARSEGLFDLLRWLW